MQKEGHVWKSDFALEHQALGREQGLEQGLEAGRREGARNALLDVLDARGFVVSQAERCSIEACNDLATLRMWSRRAISAKTVAEVFLDQAT